MPMDRERESHARSRPSKPAEGWRPIFKMPRSADELFNDVEEAAGLTWALVAILGPSVESGLEPSCTKGALQVAYCALERMERLLKDAKQLSAEEQVQMHAHIRAGGEV